MASLAVLVLVVVSACADGRSQEELPAIPLAPVVSVTHLSGVWPGGTAVAQTVPATTEMQVPVTPDWRVSPPTVLVVVTRPVVTERAPRGEKPRVVAHSPVSGAPVVADTGVSATGVPETASQTPQTPDVTPAPVVAEPPVEVKVPEVPATTVEGKEPKVPKTPKLPDVPTIP
jgi:hypothetical protein